MLGKQIHRKILGDVQQAGRGEVGIREFREGVGRDDALDGPDAADAAQEVLGLLEVVEGHGGVRVGVPRPELEVARRERADDLLEDEAALEVGVGEAVHGLDGFGYRFRSPLLRRDRRQLARLRKVGRKV